MAQVGQALGRVVEVALEVDDRRALQQDALAVALVERGGDLAHVGVALAEEHVVADADDLGEEADHRGGLAHGLAVGDLRGGLVELLGREAEQVAGRPEGVARARRLVAEDGRRRGRSRRRAPRGSRARGPRGSRRASSTRAASSRLCSQVSRKSRSWRPGASARRRRSRRGSRGEHRSSMARVTARVAGEDVAGRARRSAPRRVRCSTGHWSSGVWA